MWRGGVSPLRPLQTGGSRPLPRRGRPVRLSLIHIFSLTLKEGEIAALLGPNGAGKTTALECIEGLRTRDSGRVEISGQLGVQLQ